MEESRTPYVAMAHQHELLAGTQKTMTIEIDVNHLTVPRNPIYGRSLPLTATSVFAGKPVDCPQTKADRRTLSAGGQTEDAVVPQVDAQMRRTAVRSGSDGKTVCLYQCYSMARDQTLHAVSAGKTARLYQCYEKAHADLLFETG